MCGENLSGYWKSLKIRGSPPRVRGKLNFRGFHILLNGITPACAGKTGHLHACEPPAGDHPRVCGENSSVPERKSISSRITPACAGKTNGPCPPRDREQDHPRVCGENGLCAGFHGGRLGSPPRVRGKLMFDTCAWSTPRITPACAGKTKIRRIAGNG